MMVEHMGEVQECSVGGVNPETPGTLFNEHIGSETLWLVSFSDVISSLSSQASEGWREDFVPPGKQRCRLMAACRLSLAHLRRLTRRVLLCRC